MKIAVKRLEIISSSTRTAVTLCTTTQSKTAIPARNKWQQNIVNNEDSNTGARPAQIPLLEDVVFHTSLPLPTQPRKRRAEDYRQPVADPRAMDLFASSAEKTIQGSFSGASPAQTADKQAINGTMEAAKGELRQKTASMIDSLVEEYSAEITRRLRDELTLLLDDLQRKKP